MPRQSPSLEETVCGLAALIAGVAVVTFAAAAGIPKPGGPALVAMLIGFVIAFVSRKGAALIILGGAAIAYLSFLNVPGYNFSSKVQVIAANAFSGLF